MTLAKDISAKFAVAAVAVAMIFSAYAPAAQAQTTEDLQQMINDLLAQVATLQSQLGQGGAVITENCDTHFYRDLGTGSTGADVMKLQQFLNLDPDTRVAASGAGSAGMETQTYGPLTAAAVSKFQVKYRAEILTPLGLVAPTGYWGASSRDQANSMCAAGVPVDGGTGSDNDDDSNDDDSNDDDDVVTLSGEAALDNLEIEDAEDDDIEEGAEDAVVAEVTVEFTDGDAEISRMDIRLDNGPTGTDPWDVFDEVSIWVDGDKIADMDASDEDEYLDEDDGSIRFSGLDIIAMEDEEVEIVIAVSVMGNVDSDDLGSWDVFVDTIRFFDADGVATTEDSVFDLGSESATFNVVVEGQDDELIVKSSSNDPDATTLQLEDDSDSDWYTVFVFDLDTDDSENDIEINEMALTVTLSSSTYAAIVDDAELVIDGTTIDDVTVTGSGPYVLTFDVDGDVSIDAGDRVEGELMLKFNSLALGNEGMTVMAEITSAQADAIDAEGADDLTASQLSGSASGEAHTLRTRGIDVSPESTSATVTTQDGNTNDYATLEVEVEVTAFEQDVFIPVAAADAVNYTLVDGAGSTTVAGSRSVVLTSSADEDGTGNYYEISEGETETLTLTVTYTPGVANTAVRLRLDSIEFAETATSPDQLQTTLPQTDYRTSVVTVVN